MENGYSSGNSASSADFKSDFAEPPPPPKQANGKVGGAMAAIIQQAKTRKRKGSLRKTALLGTGKASTPIIHNTPPSPASPVQLSRAPYESSSPTSSSESLRLKPVSRSPPAPSSQPSTDEEDPLILPSQSPLVQPPGAPFPKTSTPTDSYFPPTSARHLRPPAPRLSKSTSRSPLASLPPSFPIPAPTEHSYAETAYWGWFILFVTWIVFVVGMGSCFEVWSWAWDVGETPYAPPELEDDPTLPIVGYYPCLIILTGVMAWVWVIMAWVGMKYFKHAAMGGDEA